MVTKEMLETLAELESKKLALSSEIAAIRQSIKESADDGEDVTAAGVRVYWKAGRKKIGHQQAVSDLLDYYDADGLGSMASDLRSICDDFSTTKTTYKWAAITKKAKIDTSDYVTSPAPTLTIEVQ